jgi:outer membrane protein assembly factor BamB
LITATCQALISSKSLYRNYLQWGGGALWLSGGQDSSNNRHQKAEQMLSAANVSQLSVKWQFNTAGPVSATPAIDGEMAYFPDFAGNLYALNRETGAVVWQRAAQITQTMLFRRHRPTIIPVPRRW